jgi:hypothetical protein
MLHRRGRSRSGVKRLDPCISCDQSSRLPLCWFWHSRPERCSKLTRGNPVIATGSFSFRFGSPIYVRNGECRGLHVVALRASLSGPVPRQTVSGHQSRSIAAAHYFRPSKPTAQPESRSAPSSRGYLRRSLDLNQRSQSLQPYLRRSVRNTITRSHPLRRLIFSDSE